MQDFDHFPVMGDIYLGTNKYVNEMLICIKGDKWKTLRTLATPIFTSGKLKAMVPLVDSVSVMQGVAKSLNHHNPIHLQLVLGL